MLRRWRWIWQGCGTAQYWGRRGQARDLRVRLLPVQYVRPYRINVMRGLLREHGLSIGAGACTALTRIPTVLDDPAVELPGRLRHTVALVLEDVRALDGRLVAVDHQLARVARAHPIAQRLQQVPGVGVLTSTTLVASVSHIHAFHRGRQFASWLGLTPRESSTGSRRDVGRISKRGDVDLRCLLTHGARAVLLTAQRTVRATPGRAAPFQHWAVAPAAPWEAEARGARPVQARVRLPLATRLP